MLSAITSSAWTVVRAAPSEGVDGTAALRFELAGARATDSLVAYLTGIDGVRDVQLVLEDDE